jgi:lipid-binding SYLF domain-containing protein
MQIHSSISSASRIVVLAFALAVVGCTTTGPRDSGTAVARRADIDAGVDKTLSRLSASAPDSRELVARAAGVLVFPSVLSASFVVGAQHGDGALRVGGKTVGYYDTNAGSLGFQAGAQSKAVVVLFMTHDSLQKFLDANGWTAGVDATVAVAKLGANGSIDTDTAQQPVVGFVLNNVGLMAGVSLQGAKISKLHI